ALAGGDGFGIFTAAVGRTANMAGGPATVGNTTYGFTSGIGGSWFAISNILAMWVSAPFAPRIFRAMKRSGAITVGAYLGKRFGKFTQVFTGIINFLAYTGFVASNILATGTVLNNLLGWDFKTGMLITTIIVVLYTLSGGLKSVFQINILQVSIMIVGFSLILLPISINTAGGWSLIKSGVPTEYLHLFSMDWSHILGTILIPTTLAWFTLQAGYIAVASAKDINTSWKAALLSGVLYILIAIPVIFVGMAAFILFPDAEPRQILAHTILNILPTGLIGVLVAAVISATMSTAASCTLNAVTCLFKDVLEPLNRGVKSEEKQLNFTRILIAIIGVIATLFAVLLPDVIQLLLIGYSFAAGGLLVPVFATMYWKRATREGIIASMLGGGISFLILESVLKVTWPPLFFAIPFGLVLVVVVSLMTKPQDPKLYAPYFEDTWNQLYPGKEV
ncbi:MAG: hypothetical protein Q4Q07_08500, partial [Tissierellia bacterium]|nr:hypothetical protein [Tissierellia bacterium]